MVEYSDLITINNVSLTNNSGIQGGGIFIDHNSNVELTNGTIFGNYAESGGAMTMYASTFSLLNSIVWGNPAANNQQMNLNGSTSIAYSNIQGLPGAFSGDGNTDLEPLFCNSPVGDFGLAENSPCVGAGENGTDMGALGVGCTESYINYSLNFNGDGDYVEITQNNIITGSEAVSISLWVKGNWGGGQEYLIDFGGEPGVDNPFRYMIYMQNNELNAGIEGTSGISNTGVSFSL